VRAALIALGIVLLLSSGGVVVYGRVAEWQHAQEVRSSAPPTESLPDRLPIPTSGRP